MYKIHKGSKYQEKEKLGVDRVETDDLRKGLTEDTGKLYWSNQKLTNERKTFCTVRSEWNK